jgi:hypothetical protein
MITWWSAKQSLKELGQIILDEKIRSSDIEQNFLNSNSKPCSASPTVPLLLFLMQLR